jgi:phage terminase large subunit GpA-like protein
MAARLGVRIALARLAIDSGDGATTDAVYAWARSAGPGQVVPIKGMSGFDRSTPVDGPTFVEATEGGRKIRRGVRLWKVSVSVFKAETYRFLRLSAPTEEDGTEGGRWPGGFVHLPKGTPAEWLRQLTAEQLVTVRTRQGFQRLEWQQMRERNEALDCRVYARAAAWLIGLDRWDDRRWAELEEQIAIGRQDAPPAGLPNRPKMHETPKRPSEWMGSRKDKWF